MHFVFIYIYISVLIISKEITLTLQFLLSHRLRFTTNDLLKGGFVALILRLFINHSNKERASFKNILKYHYHQQFKIAVAWEQQFLQDRYITFLFNTKWMHRRSRKWITCPFVHLSSFHSIGSNCISGCLNLF